jgi:LysM repeat protein
MRWLRPVALISLPSLTLLLPSCGTNGTASNPGRHPSGTGPFDRNGNYVEAWADTPSKWNRGKSQPVSEPAPAVEAETPALAGNDEPPADSVPLPVATTPVTRPTPAIRKSQGEVEVASLSQSKVRTKSGRATDDDAPRATTKNRTSAAATAKAKAKVPQKGGKELAKTSTTRKKASAETASSKSKTTAKSKATAAKSTKSKSVSRRYTVKKGDNLVAIANRYDTSVAALKKANSLKSSTIQPGKTLVIPR